VRPGTEGARLVRRARPRRAARGFASLVSIGAIFLITGLVAAWALPFRYRVQDEQAMRERWNAKAALEAEAASILERLSDATRGRTEDMLTFELPESARLEDTGSRINLNWVRKYVLQDSPALLALFKGGSPDELQALRQKSRLGTSVAAYSVFFDQPALDRYFTARSPMNVNTVDEFAFEVVMARATSDPASGSAWREKLRELRLSNKRLRDEGELRSWLGADWDKAELFATTVPEWNANTLEPFLLGAVLACSDFAIADPASAASAIIAARAGRYLSDADLRTILGLGEDNPIWAHLGTRTGSWTLYVSDPSGLSIEVDFAPRGETESGGAFRIRAKRWTHA
jgi:hypothetical protein